MPFLPLNDHKLFFFDCETGGLDPSKTDMVEVACVVTDPTGRNILSEYHARVFPRRPVEAKAASINGYNEEKWAEDAVTIDVAMVKLLERAKDCLFCSHNTPFDWGYFSTAMLERGGRWRGDYHRIDTVALATPLLKAGKVIDLKLGTLCDHFSIDKGEPHRAMSDARACHQLYLKLMDIYAPLFVRAP
jgi:DNA polymerase-3 subunit epsilon